MIKLGYDSTAEKQFKSFQKAALSWKKKYISDAAWSKILTFLRGVKRIHTSNEQRLRRFVEAIWWMSRSGAQWRICALEWSF
jgi:transposase